MIVNYTDKWHLALLVMYFVLLIGQIYSLFVLKNVQNQTELPNWTLASFLVFAGLSSSLIVVSVLIEFKTKDKS